MHSFTLLHLFLLLSALLMDDAVTAMHSVKKIEKRTGPRLHASTKAETSLRTVQEPSRWTQNNTRIQTTNLK